MNTFDFSFGSHHVRIELNLTGVSKITTNFREVNSAVSGNTAEWNTAMDAVEALILAHACTGVAVNDPKYLHGLSVALEAISTNV